MQFDIFLSICQTEVDGFIPSERQMFENFFDQVVLADELGFNTAWLAESHLSCQVQKQTPGAVIPHFKGEIGLNTDILQLGHKVFAATKKIHIGSAIRNILCNGGPMAHAEEVKTFLSLQRFGADGKWTDDGRKLHLGFASGRFPFSNTPYGIRPRDNVEEAAWPALKGKIFQEAVEIFLRFLKGEVFCSNDIKPKILNREDFRSDEDWAKVQEAKGTSENEIHFPSTWVFDQVGVIPLEAPMDNLQLIIGAHDAATQILANQILPCWVFNLSITPSAKIDETHDRMKQHFHKDGGPWQRGFMPRTALCFVDGTPGISPEAQTAKAKTKAVRALETYWKAMEGTIDTAKVESAVENAVYGNPAEVVEKIKQSFHPEDRLMMWFDFNNHNNEEVKDMMKVFMEQVAPNLP